MAKFTGHTITPDSALGGIELEKALRFNSGDNAYLERTPSSAGNRKTNTLSFWVKLGKTGVSDSGTVASCNSSNSDSNNISVVIRDTSVRIVGYYNNFRITNAILRDPTSWYHIVLAIDTTQASADNRIKIYVNGVQETSFSTSGNVSQNDNLGFAQASTTRVGSRSNDGNGSYFDGYLTEVNFIDGQAYDPSYFGFTETQTGQWRPKKYGGTYGTTGYHLDFSDNSSTAALGIDKSGNSNNFTPNNFSVTAGVTNDSMIDTPTNNWCVWNGLTDVSDITLSDGNLKAVSGADSWPAIFGTHGVSSGKWYYEAVGADNTRWGLGWSTEEFKSGTSNTFSVGHFAYSQDPLTLYQDGSNAAINGTPAFTTGNVLQIATDIDAGKTWFGINNTWVNASNGSAGDPAAGTNPTITFSEKGQKHYPKMINNLGNVSVNFGQQGFTYTPPDGFQALNSKTLATVNAAGVVRPQRHFETLIYDGDGSASRDITGLEFRPDVVWIKNRSQASTHSWQDSIIGFGDDKTLRVDTSNALDTNGNLYGYVNHTLPNGFNVNGGSDHGSSRVNSSSSGAKHVAWCWKAGGAAVSNSDGSITSSVSVNTEAGFSIMSYTGNGTDGATVGHGLGATPQWVMIKNKSTSSRDWIIHHPNLDSGKTIFLNSNGTQLTNAGGTATNFNNSTIRLDSGSSGLLGINHSGDDYAAYCWVEIPGYSKFGGYTGNGNANGAYVHLGFKPAWLMIKVLSNGFNWVLQDNKRSPTNLCDNKLNPDSNAVEQTDYDKLDMLSNGFKPRVSDAGVNANGSSYIYFAFAERPSGTMFGLDANAR